MAASLHIRLLGGFALALDGQPVQVSSPRLQALLAYLALHGGEPQPRRRLAFALWPDSSEAQAQTNLRTLLHRLQSALPHAETLISADAQSVGWQASAAVSCDVTDFESAIAEAGRASTLEAIAALERAAGLYAGDLLPECYDEWVHPERERLRRLLLDVLGRLARMLAAEHNETQAIEHARRLVRLDPLNEAAALDLMRMLAAAGDRAGALRVYHACATELKRELDAAPGDALREAYERLLSAEPAAPADQAKPAPFLGRAAEWRRIQGAWQAVSAGRPTLLAITGEAGIGKTRLADELCRWAARQGATVAAAHCYAAEGDLAYAPVVEWLQAERLRPALERLAPSWLTEVARLAPELLAARRDVPPPRPLTEASQRGRLFEALARAVLGADRPLLLLLDDLQWCDADTLEWLHFLLRFDAAASLLVVATLRTEELDTAPRQAELLDALRREGLAIEIALGPLGEPETADLAGQVAGRRLSCAEARQVFAQTEGNPLFVVEMVRAGDALSDPGSAEREVGGDGRRPPLPQAVRAVIGRRLMQVSPPSRELLRVAAVIGRSFTLDVLGRVASLDEDRLVRGLDELWRRRIVREHGADAYDFTHDQLRAAAYASLSPARQRLLHRRVAKALEQVSAGRLDTVSGQIAAHYQRAGLPERAAVFFQRSAEAARRVYANHEALEYVRRALAATTDEAARARLNDQLGDLLLLAGQYEEARHAWRHALADTSEDDSLALADLHRKIGNAYRDQRRYAEAQRCYAAAEASLPVAIGAPDQRLTPPWVQVQIERVSTHYWLGEVGEMLRLIERIRPVIDAVGDASQHARLHQLSAVALLRRDRYVGSEAAIGHMRAYLACVEDAGDAAAVPSARFQLGFALLWSGRTEAAEEECRAALALAERSGDVALEGRCLTYLAIARRFAGDVGAVRELAERGLKVAEAARMPDYVGAAHGNLAWAARRAGDFDGVYSHGGAALDAWRAMSGPYMFEWLARWPMLADALAGGDAPGVAAHARAMLDISQQRQPDDLERALAAAARAADEGRLSALDLQPVLDGARALGFL